VSEPAFCIVIPHYNHHKQLAASLPGLADRGLPVIVADDGSCPESVTCLTELCAGFSNVTLVRQESNGGKGSAMVLGGAKALAAGFTHMVQIDADGQHAAADIDLLLAAARKEPTALVSGAARFAADVPLARLYGRKFSLWWAWLETLSTDLQDVMCGFRVYPLQLFLDICQHERPGMGMQIDIEAMVRMSWAGAPVIFVPVAVRYPEGGLSHFHVFRDNARLSWMHTRLVLGMLFRLPTLFARKTRRS
jgi:glycosyltransferase involved in cell wall biosynthesis